MYLIDKHQLYKFDKEVNVKSNIAGNTPKQFESKVHIVKKGDTLYSISRRYFISVEEIKRMNKMNNNNLAIGQEITVKTELTKK
jgi:LysM repeat protein